MRAQIDQEERGSERTCIVTGRKDAPEAMLRFALGWRARPRAARVPRKVASTTTADATQMLTQVGFSQSGLLK